ncbi:hypothetical protein L6164_014900 [Bauhinia variegata]|uniref:Uncharacterized protein n=1 Tax=Bauhinia variegata TaxID=167791 RepID=A0ACB9NNQ7_BAUVA|nr:hypothetical protein L6164_014900 [Bauhinia variegata]
MGGNNTKSKAEEEEKPPKIPQYEDLKIRTSHDGQEKKDKDKVEEGKNDVDDGEDDSDHLSRMICPGSPSFRIYCQPQKNEGKDPHMPVPIPVHHKSLSTGSFQSFPSEISANSIESLESIPKTRYSKKGKFGSVKKLVKVKSCYYPRCTCSIMVAQ